MSLDSSLGAPPEPITPADKLEIVGKIPVSFGEMAKIVQLYVNGKPILLCGPTESLHASILETYLRARRISFTKRDGRDNSDIPELTGDRYCVVGMGAIGLFDSYIINSTSLDYDLSPDPDFNRLVLATLPVAE
jgi:hypothetical protein